MGDGFYLYLSLYLDLYLYLRKNPIRPRQTRVTGGRLGKKFDP